MIIHYSFWNFCFCFVFFSLHVLNLSTFYLVIIPRSFQVPFFHFTWYIHLVRLAQFLCLVNWIFFCSFLLVITWYICVRVCVFVIHFIWMNGKRNKINLCERIVFKMNCYGFNAFRILFSFFSPFYIPFVNEN